MLPYLLLFSTIGITKDQRDTVRESWLRRLYNIQKNPPDNEDFNNKLKLIIELVKIWPDFHELYNTLEERIGCELHGNLLKRAKKLKVAGYEEIPKTPKTRVKRPQRKRGYTDHGTEIPDEKKGRNEPFGDNPEIQEIEPAKTLDYLEKDYPELNQKAAEMQQDHLLREMGDVQDKEYNSLLDELSQYKNLLLDAKSSGDEEVIHICKSEIEDIEFRLNSIWPQWRERGPSNFNQSVKNVQLGRSYSFTTESDYC